MSLCAGLRDCWETDGTRRGLCSAQTFPNGAPLRLASRRAFDGEARPFSLRDRKTETWKRLFRRMCGPWWRNALSPVCFFAWGLSALRTARFSVWGWSALRTARFSVWGVSALWTARFSVWGWSRDSVCRLGQTQVSLGEKGREAHRVPRADTRCAWWSEPKVLARLLGCGCVWACWTLSIQPYWWDF